MLDYFSLGYVRLGYVGIVGTVNTQLYKWKVPLALVFL